MDAKRLYRTEGCDAKIAGVCGGIAEFLGLDPTLVRVGWAFLFFFGGAGFWIYLICMLIVPKKNTIY